MGGPLGLPGVVQSVETFLRLGIPGRRLEDLKGQSLPVQEKWQGMIEIRLQTGR